MSLSWVYVVYIARYPQISLQEQEMDRRVGLILGKGRLFIAHACKTVDGECTVVAACLGDHGHGDVGRLGAHEDYLAQC